MVDIAGEPSWSRLPPARPATPPGPRPRGKSPRDGRRDSAQATPPRHISPSVFVPSPDPIRRVTMCQSQEPTPLWIHRIIILGIIWIAFPSRIIFARFSRW